MNERKNPKNYLRFRNNNGTFIFFIRTDYDGLYGNYGDIGSEPGPDYFGPYVGAGNYGDYGGNFNYVYGEGGSGSGVCM